MTNLYGRTTALASLPVLYAAGETIADVDTPEPLAKTVKLVAAAPAYTQAKPEAVATPEKPPLDPSR